MLLLVLHVSCDSGCETVRLVACSCGSCNREDRGVRGSGPRNVNFLNGPKIVSE